MHTLCRIDEIAEGSARGFEIDGHSLLVARKDDQLSVFVNRCPHLGIELNFQPDEFFDLDRQFLQCANHGALFNADDGLCVHGPCKGQSLRPVPFRVEEGFVRVDAIPPAKGV